MALAMRLAIIVRQLANGLYTGIPTRVAASRRHSAALFPYFLSDRAQSLMGGPFRRVLVGWDGSADAAEALSVAATIACRDGGHVVALAVLRQQPRHEADDEQDERSAVKRQAEEHFDRLRRERPSAGDLRLSVHVVTEDRNGTGQALCDYAATHGFDLLVLGRHGSGGIRRPRLGKVADAAAHASHVPLLLLDAP